MSTKILAGYSALQRGNKALGAKNYPEAIKLLNSAIGYYTDAASKDDDTVKNIAIAKKDLSIAWNETGRAELNTNNIQEAIKAFIEAVKANPKSIAANYNLGAAYKAAGSFKEAIKSFEATKQLDPNNFETLYNLAECYKGAGQNQQAITTFQESFKCSKDISKLLTVQSKIIESALLLKNPAELNQLAKAAFEYASNQNNDIQKSNKDQLNYIMTHYGKSCLSDSNKVDYLHNVAQLYDKVNPDKTLLSALVDYIFNEYNIDKSEPKGKIINAEHQLGYLVKYYKDGVVATGVKSAVAKNTGKLGAGLKSITDKIGKHPENEGVATVKEAAILLAHQDPKTKGLEDQIASVDVDANNASAILGSILIGCE